MKCTHIEKLLPLFVENDLDERQIRLIADHLESCISCRSLSEQYAESQGWLRASPAFAFSEKTDAALRDSIRREIAADRKPDSRWSAWGFKSAFAFSATAAILLGMGLSFWRSKPEPKPIARSKGTIEQPNVSPTRADSWSNAGAILSEKRGQQHRPVRQSPPRIEAVQLPPAPSFRPLLILSDHAAALDIAMVQPGSPPEMLRIEIQTDDPNIRIIWFAPRTAGLDDAAEQFNR